MFGADIENCELLGVQGVLVQTFIGTASVMSLFGDVTSEAKSREAEA